MYCIPSVKIEDKLIKVLCCNFRIRIFLMSIPNFSIFKKGTNETYFSKDFQSVLTHIRPILIKLSVSQVYDYAIILCFLF